MSHIITQLCVMSLNSGKNIILCLKLLWFQLLYIYAKKVHIILGKIRKILKQIFVSFASLKNHLQNFQERNDMI